MSKAKVTSHLELMFGESSSETRNPLDQRPPLGAGGWFPCGRRGQAGCAGDGQRQGQTVRGRAPAAAVVQTSERARGGWTKKRALAAGSGGAPQCSKV